MTMQIDPGRYWAVIRVNRSIDENAIIGYDEPMETFFCQAFEEPPHGTPALWLGTAYRQYPTLESLKGALTELGASVVEWEIEPKSKNFSSSWLGKMLSRLRRKRNT